MVAKMRWERVGFAISKAQRTHRVEKSARDKQGYGACAKLVIDGTDQEDDDPAHEQETQVRHPYRNFCEEDGFQRDEENRQAPDDTEQDPTRRSAEDGETKWRVRPGDEDIDGVVVQDAEDTQVFVEEQEEMQKAAEEEG